jgi:nucleotide-binding universal stress UspA family protein
MIQKLLCPTDLTDYSKDVVRYAFSLAQRNGAQLIVFHALSFPSIWQYPCEIDVYCRHWEQQLAEFRMDRLLSDGERRVNQFVCRNLRNASGGVAWKPRVGIGKAADEIVTAALRENVDLIVISRRQRPWLARVFARGIVATVSRNAPCPILLLDGSQLVARTGGWHLPVLEETPSY